VSHFIAETCVLVDYLLLSFMNLPYLLPQLM